MVGSPDLKVMSQGCKLKESYRAPVAQLDRAAASGAVGREFESLRARQFLLDTPAFSRSLATLGISPFDLTIKVPYCNILARWPAPSSHFYMHCEPCRESCPSEGECNEAV